MPRHWAKQMAWEAQAAESKWRKAMKEEGQKSERYRRNEDLKLFWAKFFTASKEAKLALLKVMADARYETGKIGRHRTAKMRARFNSVKKLYFHLGAKNCEVCDGPAAARHHIVQIQNGGGNHGNNLMRLCEQCHAEVHPWMKNTS